MLKILNDTVRQLADHGISMDNDEHGGGAVESAPAEDNGDVMDESIGGQDKHHDAGTGGTNLGLMPAPSQGGRGQE